MSTGHRVITPWSFAQACEAAGVIHDPGRIREFVIRCAPDDVVTIEVTYFADERIYGLANPASRDAPPAEVADAHQPATTDSEENAE